ncbi:Transcription elongation factor B polypeptide 3 [Cytospora mali]|uniref:Transcription elongation factor B polypeptide 3 n=1 Tax=Cytospora mali TaxID=578113 RepID=A0A194VPB5_CYTMA|nr:Transcription elongation factor B polypeptide 3 [Valsa mali]
MSVPSLAGLCRKTIFANIDELSYVSTLPYEKCREILKHVKNPQQLAIIEEYSPQIVGEDSELWEAFIRRDFPVPMKRKNYEPENPRSWRKVYERYEREEREAEAHALAQLGATFAGLNKAKQENRTNIADPRLLPRIGRIGVRRRRGFGTGTTNLTFGGGARTKNVVQKAKKEAMEVAARKKLSTPALKPRANLVKVQRAPESMRNEYRIKKQPAFLTQTQKRPREEDEERAQREARLLAAKKSKVQPLVLRDDELEDSRTEVRPAAAATTNLGASSGPKKSTPLFSRANNPSRQQNKVIVKTVGKPVSGASPEKDNRALKARPGHTADLAKKYTQADSSSISRVSSPGSDDFTGKIRPKRSSRSPSVTSSLFGSPEPEPPASDRRRSSFHSSDGRSLSPPAAPSSRPHSKRPGAYEAAKVQSGEAKAGPSSKRRIEDSAVASTSSADATSGAGGGGTAAQPLRKKKKVDIFMRPKKVTR